MSIGKLVNKIIDGGGDATDILAEPRRRAALQVSRLKRHIRKRAKTAKGAYYRRIIAVSYTRIPDRRCELHATKGWRSYRLSPA